MPLVDDSLALATPESIVLDGANGVLAEPRQHFPHGLAFTVVALLVLVGAWAWLRPGARRAGLAVLLLVAAAPGLVGVLVLRADAPLRRGELARTVATAVATLETNAPWPGPVAVVREEDDVRFPLGRYAVPSRPAPASPTVELELVGTKLATDCHLDAATRHLVCGDAR